MRKTLFICVGLVGLGGFSSSLFSKEPLIKFGNAKLVVEDPTITVAPNIVPVAIEQNPSTVSVTDAKLSKVVIEAPSIGVTPVLLSPQEREKLTKAARVEQEPPAPEIPDASFFPRPSLPVSQSAMAAPEQPQQVSVQEVLVMKAQGVPGSVVHLPSSLISNSVVVPRQPVPLGGQGQFVQDGSSNSAPSYYTDSEAGALLKMAATTPGAKSSTPVVGGLW